MKSFCSASREEMDVPVCAYVLPDVPVHSVLLVYLVVLFLFLLAGFSQLWINGHAC